MVGGELVGTLDLLPISIMKLACEDFMGPRMVTTCRFFKKSMVAEAA